MLTWSSLTPYYLSEFSPYADSNLEIGDCHEMPLVETPSVETANT